MTGTEPAPPAVPPPPELIDAGPADPRILVILRGNSGSGKTSIARAVRAAYGRGAALIEQDQLRRMILREHDSPPSTGIAPGFIANAAAYALAHGYHVVLEGILNAARYGDALLALIDGHDGPNFVYYLDVSVDETVRRHATRPEAADFTPAQMRGWYTAHDVLGTPGEHVIAESSTFAESVDLILRTSRLTGTPPVTYCPTTCPHCRAETRSD
jgi:predicted kinase